MRTNNTPARMKTTPVAVPKTGRNHNVVVQTSLPAGRMVPVAAIPSELS